MNAEYLHSPIVTITNINTVVTIIETIIDALVLVFKAERKHKDYWL